MYNGDFDEAVKFRNVFIRLIFQATTHKSWETEPSAEVFETFCTFKEAKPDEYKTPQGVKDIFAKLTKEATIEFACIGELLSLDAGHQNTKPIVISPHYIFSVRNVQAFVYEMQIYDENAACLYTKVINDELKYYINNDNNSVNWVDVKAGQLIHLAFKFRDDNAAKNLSVIFSMSILQTLKKKSFDDIAKEGNNEDWKKYYGTPETEEDDLTNQSAYDGYVDYDRMDVEFTNNPTFVEPQSFKNINQTHLAQAKLQDRTFVSQENNISVYKPGQNDNFNVRDILL